MYAKETLLSMNIRLRFMIIIGLLSFTAIIWIGVASYSFSVHNTMIEAKAKGKLVFDFLESFRLHFKYKQRPKIMKLIENIGNRTDMPVDLISGFALTRGVWNEFILREDDYHFKQATVDPLVLANKADATDLTIIDKFKANPNVEEIEGTIKKSGASFYYFAQQIPVGKECLRCHGAPEKAPQWQQIQYGTEHGYNWKEGDIVSSYIIYVPLQNALNLAKKNTFILIVIGSAIILLLMLAIWIFFSSYVVKPLSMLEKRTTDISLGKNLSEPISTLTQDEIGTLACAVDLLRISIEKMLIRSTKSKIIPKIKWR
jgi:methyl-accepting chemotaxis protein